MEKLGPIDQYFLWPYNSGGVIALDHSCDDAGKTITHEMQTSAWMTIG